MTKSTITRERLLEIIVTGPEASGAEQNELARMALAAMDSEPVAEVVSIYGDPEAFGEREIIPLVGIQQMPYGTKLYRHAQPALVVMDDEKLRTLFDAWFASDCSFDQSPKASEADNIAWRESYWYVWQRCRAAMLAAAPYSPSSEPATVPGKWIPVSERMPDENAEQQVLACFKGGDISTLYYFEGRWDDAYGIVPIRQDVTHWMPLPAAPQEIKS